MSSNRDGSAMFRDQVEVPETKELQLPLPSPPSQTPPELGKKIKLKTNCFSLSMSSSGAIYHYTVSMVPAAATLDEEAQVMHKIWDQLVKTFNGVFIVRSPGHIFTPTQKGASLTIPVPVEAGQSQHGVREVSINFRESISAQQVNSGKIGIAGVVMQHVVKRLTNQLQYQKVGRRYYDNNAEEVKVSVGSLLSFSSFYAGMQAMSLCGPIMQIDTLHRTAQKRNIIEHMAAVLEREPTSTDDPEVEAEWRRRCIGATVVTLYNNRVYQIKDVDFASKPNTEFNHWRNEDKSKSKMTYRQYYQAFYQRDIVDEKQPLLLAYAEKDHETVKLVPELCALLGFNDEMRKDKAYMTSALKQTKVNPPDRLKDICDLVGQMGKSDGAEVHPQQAALTQLLQDWKLNLDKSPMEVEAVIHEQLDVSFGDSPEQRHPIEEGNFQRWMRNSLQCPARLDDWLFIYPESDIPVLDVWLRSLRDIAQVAFAMKMADPTRVICTDQRRELVQLLENRLTPKTQMILLLTPQKDCKKVYEIFKHTTISRFPCVTQVVKSETIRKRQSIAAVLSRIVLQINAKYCGPLWSIELKTPKTATLMQAPTMVIGLDVFTSHEGAEVERYLGFAASLDTRCVEYYSMATRLDRDDWRGCISEKIQEFLREAILQYSRRNEKMLPEHVIVYRASSSEDQWSAIKQTEVEAFNTFFGSLNALHVVGQKYSPVLTFVAISKHCHMRFFHPTEVVEPTNPDEKKKTFKNPEPGTIIDVPMTSRADCITFYLVNQAAAKGSTNPTHYTLLYDSASVEVAALQSLTYRLSYLYFNFTGSVKMPAPAQYAKKIAHLIGTAVRSDPHKRLLCSFFYL